MPFVVVYDASVLHPPTVRDLLIRIAQAGLVQARWTNEILDETSGRSPVAGPTSTPVGSSARAA